MQTRVLFAVPLAVAAVGLAGCGGSSYGGSSSKSKSTSTAASSGKSGYGAPAASSSSGSGQTVKVAADPGGALKFANTSLSAKAGTVTIDMSNPSSSGVPHGIGINGNGVDKDGKVVPAGSSSTVTLKLKPGTYTFYCPVPSHKSAGMVGKLVVT